MMYETTKINDILKALGKALDYKNNKPLFSSLFMRAEQGFLSFQAAGDNFAVAWNVPYVGNDFMAMIDPRKAMKFLNANKKTTVGIEYDNEKNAVIFKLDNDRMYKASSKISEETNTPIDVIYRGKWGDQEYIPFMVDSAFKNALEGAIKYASNEATRYYLNGVYLDGKLKNAVATNGHIMSIEKVDIESDDSIIVGREFVNWYLKAPIPMQVGKWEYNENGRILRNTFTNFAGSGENVEIAVKGIDGTYPDYMRVVPKYDEWPKMNILTDKFRKEVKLFKDMGFNMTVFELQKQKMYASDDEGNELISRIPFLLGSEYEGYTRLYGFNPKYLWDIANEDCDILGMRIDPDNAATPSVWKINPEKFIVLMPMRAK